MALFQSLISPHPQVTPLDRVRIVRCAQPEHDPVRDFAESIVLGLSDRPRWTPARFLYDAEGSRLFERITETPEYYLTRTETALLERSVHDIGAETGPRTIVELGSGSGAEDRAPAVRVHGAARTRALRSRGRERSAVGSCATPQAHIRSTYRNFFPPDTRW